MKDTELRGLLLEVFYRRRREGWLFPTPEELGVQMTEEDVLHVCSQLGEHGLIDWTSTGTFCSPDAGMGRISAFGVDVVEGEAKPDIKVEFVNHQTVNISGSSHVVVGDNNSQTVVNTVQDLVALIEAARGSPEQKAEAKSLLRKFLEHPLLASIAGGAIGLLG